MEVATLRCMSLKEMRDSMEQKRLANILIVDDEPRMREMIRMILENRNYGAVEASNGMEAITKAREEGIDLIIMDVMMPLMNGYDSCRHIRKESSVPIIMLTAKGEDYDQVDGFDNGADDYIIKPFAPMVLMARIEAALRRKVAPPEEAKQSSLIEVDNRAREIRIKGSALELNRKEYELLEYLVVNQGMSISRNQLLEKVWGYDYLGSDSTVDTHMNRLRKKLGDYSGWVTTIRGYGYKLEVPDER